MSKFDKFYDYGHCLPDGVTRETDAMIGGKRVLVRGCVDVSTGSAFALKGTGALMLIMEIDPINALLACIVEGFRVVTLESVVDEVGVMIMSRGMAVTYIIEDGVIKVGAKTGDIRPREARYMPPAGIGASPIARASGRLAPRGGGHSLGNAGAIDTCHGVVHDGKHKEGRS